MASPDNFAPAAETAALRWSFGSTTLDERSLQLTVDGAPVDIEPKPLQLLMYLLRRCGEVVTREEILDALWPGRIVTDGVITNCVAKLRVALGDKTQELVCTVPRYGYRLSAEVRAEPIQRDEAVGEQLGLSAGMTVPNRPQALLLRLLSDRGLSEVWLAQLAESTEQRVFKFARDASELAFLKREITLNRVLREAHGESGHLVRILSWNLERPPFFLESEYVVGGNLEQWCASQGGVGALPLALRVNLAAQCATAAAQAHSAGVLHKDLKPGNVLVAFDDHGQPRVRLCDFGAGSMVEGGLFDRLGITRMGFTQTHVDASTPGTPLYQAPELFAGYAPTVQSDVYALGVLLFQLVVGDLRRVLAPGWEAQVEDALLREDIAAAAHGDPGSRLSDASQLAERLSTLDARRAERERRAHLEARAEADRIALTRAQARRGLLQALSLTLAVGTLTITGLYLNARQAHHEANQQAQTTQAVVSFLADDLLAFANPRAQGSGDLRVRDLLDAAANNLQSRFHDQPVVRARLQRTIGAAYGSLGLIQPAEANLLSAIATLSRELGDSDAETQSARMALRDSYRIVHRFADVLPVGEAIRSAEEAAGRRQSAQWFEGAWSALYGACELSAGSLWFDDCGLRMQPLVEQARVALGSDHPVTARMIWIRATLSLLFERHEGLEPLLAEAYTTMRGQMSADHPRVTEARMFWAWAILANGDAARAERIFREVADSFEVTVGRDHDFYIASQFHLARALVARGELAEAEPLFRLSWNWRREHIGIDNFVTANSLAALNRLLIAQRRAGEAVALADEAQRELEAVGRGETLVALRYGLALAAALGDHGETARQGRVLQTTEQKGRALLVKGQWYLGEILAQRGVWLLAQGQGGDALALLTEAVAVLEKARGPDDRYTRRAAAALADAHGT